PVNNAMGSHHCAGTQRHMFAHDAVSADTDVVGDFRARRHNGGGMNEIRHCHDSSTRIAHISLASAATWPSTVACAVYLPIERLMRSAETSSRSWSPGTTGRRKRAPSTPTR